jgi:hypothetical protein
VRQTYEEIEKRRNERRKREREREREREEREMVVVLKHFGSSLLFHLSH